MSVIEVKNLTKEYQLGALTTIRASVMNIFRRLQGKPPEERKCFKALDDISFSIEKGEVVGIIGHNGAGKSTLLKHLAKITTPTSGSVSVSGTVAPLIEVGAGFVPDLTGRENIYLNCSIMGLSRKKTKAKIDKIIEFSELEEFIDTPIKRYSSGMSVRLGFAVATSLEADILIVDEVLAVGDLAFQRKCFDRMEDLIKHQGKTVLIVSHNIRQIERLCDRVIMLDHGHTVAEGDPTEVSNLFFDYSNKKIKSAAANSGGGKHRTSDELTFNTMAFFNEHGQSVDRINFLSPFRVRVQFTINKPLERICFLVGAHTTDFVYLTANNNVEDPHNFEHGEHAVELNFDSMTLLPGVYSMRAWIGTPEGRESFYGENLFSFQVYSDDHLITRQQEMGVFYMKSQFEIDPSQTNATPLIDQH